MATKDITDDGSVENKTTLVNADRKLIIDSEINPNELKEITWQDEMAQAAAYTQTLTNKTLTSPTIANFTNATHNHTSSTTGGGVLRPYFASYLGFLSPADSTTYYFGLPVTGAATTTDNSFSIPIAVTGTVKRIDLFFRVEGILGSNEQFTTSFRLNGTTDTTIATTCKMDAAYQKFSNSSLSISVSANDTFEIKFVTPAWATNPTNTRGGAFVYIE